ncbi:MAG: hypothetical protein QY330_05445 [Candidatus Dojkabacteria bacterium]|nr:MAG: hypothetical protein QY330_05445 [Candidatus Dojkabacteria bacterium]
MQEIVPPKLNRETGILSIILNRRNFLVLVAILLSFTIWSTEILNTPDQKILAELVLGGLLIPFMFDAYGRPLHVYLIDGIKHVFSKKRQRIVLGKDISEGIIIVNDYQYSRVFQIEPINLSMSSEEDIYAFKKYLQQALFALKHQIQIITIQKHSTHDKALETEIGRYKNLKGKLQDECKSYLLAYQDLTLTMERSFYLVLTAYAKGLDDAKLKLEDQENSFGKLLEQTKVRLIPLSTQEILNLSNHILLIAEE